MSELDSLTERFRVALDEKIEPAAGDLDKFINGTGYVNTEAGQIPTLDTFRKDIEDVIDSGIIITPAVPYGSGTIGTDYPVNQGVISPAGYLVRFAGSTPYDMSQPYNPQLWALAGANQASPGNINWDVSIPFNDDLEVERGYGNRDSYGNRAVDFDRASVATYTNKSGQFETADVDEPCIGSNGISIYESYINYFANPQSPVTQVCTIPPGDYTLWVEGAGTASTSYGNATDSTPLTFTSLGEGLTVTLSGSLSLVNLINLNKEAPPILEPSAPSSRSSEPCSIPMMNNMPAAGKPFTIMVDCAIPFAKDGIRRVIANGTFTTGFSIYRQKNNNLEFRINNGSGSSVVVTATVDDLKHRVVAKYNDLGEQFLYIDGLLVSQESPTQNPSPSFDMGSSLTIGSTGSFQFINSELKNFRIIHRALSDSEIVALGGAY